MLFDLRSPRRKAAVTVVFSFIAFVFVLSFVVLGVGSGNNVNPFSSFTSGSGQSQVDYSHLNQALKAAKANPTSAAAWAQVLQQRESVARQLSPQSTTGAPAYSKAGLKQLVGAGQAWQQYLKYAKPPDPGLALLAAREIYEPTAQFPQASAAWQVAISQQPSSGSYQCLAANAWAAKQNSVGDLASQKAIATAGKFKELATKQTMQAIKKQAPQYAMSC